MTKKTMSALTHCSPRGLRGSLGGLPEALHFAIDSWLRLETCLHTRLKGPKAPQAFPKHLPGTVVDRFFVNLLRRLSHALLHGCIAFFGMT